MGIKFDSYTKALLTVIALLLAVLAYQNLQKPNLVHAQSSGNLYIEPGVVSIRSTDGLGQVDGRMVIDLTNGNIWGFPTLLAGAPYPINVTSSDPPVSKPVYLGKFDFDQILK